jgi:hypothetical protein
MANSIGPLGLTTNTQAELLANLTTLFQNIYGADIVITSNSPDGQLINGFIQVILDDQDLLTQIYNTFDPDNAVGVILDQRVAINGIQRQAGTLTVTNITIVTNQSVNLYGSDQSVQPVYTVSDNAGNLWELGTTQIAVPTGTNVFAFQSAVTGAITPLPNTLTIQVTIVLGVISVNNPTAYTTLGTNEESDAALKIRRQKSVSQASQGYLKGLLAALENINGVTSAFVYENDTSVTDIDGVPGHTIWVIIAGSPDNVDVATAIYEKRNAGCGMFGQTFYNVIQVNSTSFTVYWDYVTPQNLFIAFTATSIDGINQPAIANIRSGLVTNFVPGVFQEVNINEIATQVQDIDPNTLVTNCGLSNGGMQIATLSGIAASGSFVVNYNGDTSAAINWNDSISTIQSKVQAITGLTSALVTGSIASQTLNFNLSAIVNIFGLIYVTSNTLQTSLAVPITFSFNEDYQDILTPTSKSLQFAIASGNIIILPMILSPTTSTVSVTQSETFVGLGGYGDYTYSLFIDNSGATVNSLSGLYTAGSTPNVTDTVKVVDVFGNSAIATIAVTT